MPGRGLGSKCRPWDSGMTGSKDGEVESALLPLTRHHACPSVEADGSVWLCALCLVYCAGQGVTVGRSHPRANHSASGRYSHPKPNPNPTLTPT